MTIREDLSLEEKLRIPILKLPFSREVKQELYDKSVTLLRHLYDKYHSEPGRVFLPAFKNKVFAEAGYLLVALGLDYGDWKKNEYNILDAVGSARFDKYVKGCRQRKIDKYAKENV
jgi:hypothetical protein